MARWINEGKKLLGLHEIKGAQHAPEILQMWKDIKRGGIKDDETAWCAAFVGAMLERSGIRSSRFEAARSYLSWGIELKAPAVGCIVVFGRDSRGGHVGFVVGQDKAGNLQVLGGNQSDKVSIATFPLSRVLGYRWPAGEPVPVARLPIMTPAELSRSEA